MAANEIRHAVYLPPFGPFGDPAVLVDLAVRAETAGWDGFFLWDHVISGGLPIVDTWTTLAAIAQATHSILLGPMVTPLARRRPWLVARQAATVSALSGGRLILGAGLGSDESGDFSRFGEVTDPATRAALLDEGLAIAEAVWSGKEFEHSGRHFSVRLPQSAPVAHRIPVWLASSGQSAAVLRRAAAHDGIFPNPGDHTPTPDEVSALRQRVSGDIAIAGNASLAWPEPPKADVRALAAAGMTWWLESLIHFDPLALSQEIVDAGPRF